MVPSLAEGIVQNSIFYQKKSCQKTFRRGGHYTFEGWKMSSNRQHHQQKEAHPIHTTLDQQNLKGRSEKCS